MKYKEIPQAIQAGNWECMYTILSFVNAIETWKKEGLQMNPDFQRGHVWSKNQKVEFINSMLEGKIKSSNVIYLNNNKWQNYEANYKEEFYCVDGLQRSTAIIDFYHNRIAYKNKYYLDDFEDKRFLLRTSFIKININSLKYKHQVLEWYLQLNTMGKAHTKEEINKVKDMLNKENKND